jgi:excisionase family DNA binding protein
MQFSESENLTVREVAAFLRVSIRSVYNLIERGQIPSLRIGRVIRIPRARFIDWIDTTAKAKS